MIYLWFHCEFTWEPYIFSAGVRCGTIEKRGALWSQPLGSSPPLNSLWWCKRRNLCRFINVAHVYWAPTAPGVLSAVELYCKQWASVALGLTLQGKEQRRRSHLSVSLLSPQALQCSWPCPEVTGMLASPGSDMGEDRWSGRSSLPQSDSCITATCETTTQRNCPPADFQRVSHLPSPLSPPGHPLDHTQLNFCFGKF